MDHSSMSSGSMSMGTSNSSLSTMTMMDMSSMMMTFFTAANTPLYSTAWTPASDAQYAGTCVFLILLAFIAHALFALRSRFVALYTRHQRRYDPSWRAAGIAQGAADDKDPAVVHAHARTWTIEEAVPRALLDVAIAGVGYLLMIAVMTMNVGYFVSVLAGVFLGSFVFGHRVGAGAAH